MEDYQIKYKNQKMQPKESKSNKHFWLSMVKSGLRLFGCGYLMYGDFVGTAVIFAIAEILGVVEEF
jgi:hypothetical protein